MIVQITSRLTKQDAIAVFSLGSPRSRCYRNHDFAGPVEPDSILQLESAAVHVRILLHFLAFDHNHHDWVWVAPRTVKVDCPILLGHQGLDLRLCQ